MTTLEERRKCAHIMPNGQNCGWRIGKDVEYCYRHSDTPSAKEAEEIRKAAVAKTYARRKGVPEEDKTIIDVMRSAWKEQFGDFETWKAWIAFLEALYGLPFSKGSYEIYKRCTERKIWPKEQFEEAYAMVGRGGGKSFVSALIATYSALYGNWEKYLNVGERARVFCIATDQRQADVVLGFIKGFLEAFPNMIVRETSGTVDLANRVTISISTCTIRAGRGYAVACLICDELAFWRDKNSANPADDVITSVIPRLLDKGHLIGISSSYASFGYLYEVYRQYFGKEDPDVLFWKAPTLVMNPTYNRKKIARLARGRNSAKFNAEFSAEFREDIESYLSGDDVDAVIAKGQRVILPKPETHYRAFADPSGGKGDSFAMAIAHAEGEKIILDRVEEWGAPLDPKVVIERFSAILKEYNVFRVSGDEYAGKFCSSEFASHGILYDITEAPYKTKNDIYLFFQPLALTKRIELLDIERIKLQFQSLEWRRHSGGRESVDHPRGLHDDIANVVAGVSTILYRDLTMELSAEYRAQRLPSMMGGRGVELNSPHEQQRDRVLTALKESGDIK